VKPNPGKRERFAPTALLVWSGLLIWALNFLCIYIFAALACARRFSHLTIAGLPIVPAVTSAVSVATFAATLAFMWVALKRGKPAESTLLRFLALTLGTLALLATAWVALPPLILDNRC
jgi:uncharacterized membrane protein